MRFREEDIELGRLRALAENAAAQVTRERERRQAAEQKIAAAAAMAAEAQVRCLSLVCPFAGCLVYFAHVICTPLKHFDAVC